MSALKSSVLILGPGTQKSKDLGAELFDSQEAITKFLTELGKESTLAVLVLDYKRLELQNAVAWLTEVHEKWPLIQILIIVKDPSGDSLKDLINTGLIFKVLPSFEDPYYESSIQEALATVDLLKQTDLLVRLHEEQNAKLLNLQKDLESRVEKRQQNLSESREKLIRTNRRTESFHRAIVAIQKSKSIKEIEKLVAEALFPSLQISNVRISFLSTQPSKGVSPLVGFCSVPMIRDGLTIGYVGFSREKPFSEAEQTFLDQLSSAIALAIDRLAKFEQAETLKQQWQSTFDAITEPVAIIDQQYNVVRANSTFSHFSSQSESTTKSQKCYESLFGRSSPCIGCKLGSRFELDAVKTQDKVARTLLVSSQTFEDEGLVAYINIYNDMTEKREIEKRLLESVKLAELGTVGGSIAHELNNPIAGMLTFTQLIRMDLKGDEPYFEDITEIEKGILRCRDIIQNLLSSIRKIATEPVKSLKEKK